MNNLICERCDNFTKGNDESYCNLSFSGVECIDNNLFTEKPGKYHVSVMKRNGVYSDKVFDNAADAKCELCYARGDDYSDNVLGLSIWKEFK